MSKRRKYRYWNKEEKHRIIKRLFTEDIGVRELCREEKITTALIYKWKAAYEEFGEQGLENSVKPRNPLAKLQLIITCYGLGYGDKLVQVQSPNFTFI